MNWLDLAFIVLVVMSGLVGIWIGLVRAAFGVLGVVVGILVAGQVSGDVGRLYAGIISNETLAYVIAYGLIILVSIVVARVLTIVVRHVVYMLFMGWLDKLAGLAIGLIAGAAISGALIVGLAELTFNSDLIEKAAGAEVLVNKAHGVAVKEKLEGALIDSALVGAFFGVRSKLPASSLGFVPSNFVGALETLQLRIDG